jgi:hypothetical protein
MNTISNEIAQHKKITGKAPTAYYTTLNKYWSAETIKGLLASLNQLERAKVKSKFKCKKIIP